MPLSSAIKGFPLYFLISLWGIGSGRQTAAVRYFLVMLAGGVPLLFGPLTVAFGHAGEGGMDSLAFDLPTLLATPLPEGVQMGVFLLLVGFGVKVPLPPLHTWLPSLAMGAPAAVTALLVGLKLGAYGLIRFAIPLAPIAARDPHWLLAGLGTVAILYGAVAALTHSNRDVGDRRLSAAAARTAAAGRRGMGGGVGGTVGGGMPDRGAQ